MSKKNFVRGADRSSNHHGSSVVHVVGLGEQWTTHQRELLRRLSTEHADLDARKAQVREVEDDIAITALELVETGVTKTRIIPLFKVGSVTFNNMLERGRTARALREIV